MNTFWPLIEFLYYILSVMDVNCESVNCHLISAIVGNLFLIMKWHLTFICWPFLGARPTGWTSVAVFKSEWTINTKIEAVSWNNPLKPQTVSSCSLHQFINHVLWLVNRFPHFNNMFPLFPCILRAVGTLWVLDASLFSIFFFSLDFSAVPGSVWGNQQLKIKTGDHSLTQRN